MFAQRSVRTDLAIESHEFVVEQSGKNNLKSEFEVSGVEVENSGTNDVKVNRVRITSKIGEEKIGKPIGNYITIEAPRLMENVQMIIDDTCKTIASELEKLIKLDEESTVLVVGLGNWNVTPDALGPKVISKLMVTRHLLQYIPEKVDKGVRPVCAIAPGVLGITGIETGEIVKGIVEKIKPNLIIAIDALASRRMSRVTTTIQLADTGIAPGSGVGNKRMELSSKTLGVPVIAIGVPTVVDAATMANDTIDLVLDSMIKQAQEGTDFYNMLNNLDRDTKYNLIQEVLGSGSNLIVTPKEIDDIIEKMSQIISSSINLALHKGVSLYNMNKYIN